MWSLGFSKFRKLMDLWDEAVLQEKHANKVNGIIEINGLIFFFVKDGEVYGASEEGRLVFAKMKDPHDKDLDDRLSSFAAYSLKKALAGHEVSRVFGKKDLKTIKVISQDKAVELLSNKPTGNKSTNLKPLHGKDGAGVVQLKDRKK